MKSKLTSVVSLALLVALIVGCGGGSGEARNATDGASKSAIQEYEDAVKAAQGSMSTEEEKVATPATAEATEAKPAAE